MIEPTQKRHAGAKDFNVKVSVRNNRLLSAIRENHDTVSEFCREFDLSITGVNGLICFRDPPMKKNGEWRPLALDVAAALGAYPSDLWPKHFERAQTKRATAEIEASAEEVAAIAAPDGDIERQILQRKLLANWARNLRPRELKVVALRQQGATLEEVAKEFGVKRQRVRQIEQKAYRKMRVNAAKQGIKSMVDV